MAAIPPAGSNPASDADLPWWMLIGPGIATITSLFMLTAVYNPGERVSLMIVELGLSDQDLLVKGVLAYLVAAAITAPLGFVLGRRYPTALVISALGIMLIGVLLTSFASGGTMLLAGRVFSGLGAGVAVGVTATSVRRIRGAQAVAATVVAVLGVLAAVAAPFINKAISEALSFRLAHLATVLFLFVALLASIVSGITRAVSAGRPGRPAPYGMPYAPQQYPSPHYPPQQFAAPQSPPQQFPAPQNPQQFAAPQNSAQQFPAPQYPPPDPGR